MPQQWLRGSVNLSSHQVTVYLTIITTNSGWLSKRVLIPPCLKPWKKYHRSSPKWRMIFRTRRSFSTRLKLIFATEAQRARSALVLLTLPGWSQAKSGFCLSLIQEFTLYLYRRGAEDAESFYVVIARNDSDAAIFFDFDLHLTWDCFASLAMTTLSIISPSSAPLR